MEPARPGRLEEVRLSSPTGSGASTGVTSVYPILQVQDVVRSRNFYVHWFGFAVTFESDWYVSLRSPESGSELALLDHRYESIPVDRRHPSKGVIISVEVEDVDAWWDRLVVRGGLEVETPIRDEPFGQRHFITFDPDDNMVDVITPTTPSPEFADMYRA